MRRLTYVAVFVLMVSCGGQARTPAGEAGGATAAGAGGAGASQAGDADLIPRKVFFGNPDKVGPQLSPDGSRLSYLAPVDGVLNVWVGPASDPSAAKPVTKEKKRPLRSYFWAYTGEHILYLQDEGGDENWHVFVVDLESGEIRDLTPIEGVAAQVVGLSHRQPGRVVVGLNDRDKRHHDLYSVDIETGERKLLEKNEQGYIDFELDEDFEVRFAQKMDADGGSTLFKREKSGEWAKYFKIPFEDSLTTQMVGLNAAGDVAFLRDSRRRDTSALVALDLKSGERKVLAEDDRADIGGVIVDPKTKEVLAASFTYTRKAWKVIDESVQPDLEKLEELADGEVSVADQTLDNRKWLVAIADDDGPVRYYVWDRDAQSERFLFVNRQELQGLELAPMHPEVIESRDGLNLVSYLTLPKGVDPDADGRPDEAQPMVLVVHGGPWGRDDWGYDPLHQLLSDRRYAALSVNFRGSTGFGKEFLNAGNREWAGKMQDDLVDAVRWAVAEGIAKEDQICILGGSYGGYATLVGMTFTPELFACGVDIVGPSNLITLLETIPPYWAPLLALFKTRVGDWSTEEGKEELLARSPISKVEEIERPLLIGQGANDPRVKQAESDQIVEAMQEKDIPVTYVLFPDEGHGFARTENSLAFWAVTEAFLSVHLGGPHQPLRPEDFEGSSIQVPEGAGGVPGLKPAIAK